MQGSNKDKLKKLRLVVFTNDGYDIEFDHDKEGSEQAKEHVRDLQDMGHVAWVVSMPAWTALLFETRDALPLSGACSKSIVKKSLAELLSR